jgi:DNA-binding MarR family transcriptional regulator
MIGRNPGRDGETQGRFCVAAQVPILFCRSGGIAPSRFPAFATAPEHDHFAKASPLVTNESKYVNMTDVTVTIPPDRPAPASTAPGPAATEPLWDVIELLFFAYRDFVGDPDDVLAKLGFGRAHHRVLHFVNRNPGMKVADLLDILKITKQSLGRVLKQLVDQGYVVQKEGANDRRQRLLSVTAKGETLAMKLAGLQTERIARALAEFGPGGHEAARTFLAAMIDAQNRDGVLRLIARADRARQTHR